MTTTTTDLRRSLLLVLLLALPIAAVAADPPPADTAPAAPVIALPTPWKAGDTLRYESEQVSSKASPTKREKTRGTAITELSTRRADETGFEVHWTSRDVTHATIDGDAAMDGTLRSAMEELAGEPMVVTLNADGSYREISNIAHLSKRMREVLGPVVRTAMESELRSSTELDPAQREAALAKANAMVATYLDNITAPRMLEVMAGKQAQHMAYFSGGGLEDGATYTSENELENPTGGPPFPSKMTFSLWVSEDDPEDVFIEWKSSIDPVKGASAVMETAARLFGEELKAALKDAPQTISIEDSGLILVHRPTGVVEMYEDERTTTFGEHTSYERHRMRLLDAGHGHDWTAE